jgi:ribonuclease BN (tRNA processing enzyme)
LTVVGCAGSFPGPDSPASCYLLEGADAGGRTWRILLDLGNGALGPLQRLLPLREVDAVLLSHLHPDHCLDLCGLYVALRYDPKGAPPRPMPVYGPTGTLRRLQQGYGTDGAGGLAEIYDVVEWQQGVPVAVGPFTVTPLRVEHPVEAFGLRVEHGRGVLAYTGDTDACPALEVLARDADVLLAEASFQEGRERARGVHLTGLRAGQVATRAAARSLVLTHLPAWTAPEVVRAEARSAYTGPLEVTGPGRVYEIPRP